MRIEETHGFSSRRGDGSVCLWRDLQLNGLEFSLPSTCMFSNVKHEIFGDLARTDWLLEDRLKAFRNNAKMRCKTEKRLEDITITGFVEIVLSRLRPTHARIGILNFKKMMIQIFEKNIKN